MTEANMQKITTLILALAFFTPIFAMAQINSQTSAESDTGGNAGSGSTGNASASSHSTTVIDGSGNGTVEVNVKTETNGIIQEETIKKEVQGGVEVRVSTTSRSTSKTKTSTGAKTESEAQADVELKTGTILSQFASTTFWHNFPIWFSFNGEATTTSKTEFESEGRVLTMIERPQGSTTPSTGVRGFVAKILDIVIFWR